MRLRVRVPWWLAVFGLALALRLAFVLVADEPLVDRTPYIYFTKALWIAERPDALSFVLTSDAWHNWGRNWTMAPLYTLFAAAVFGLFGPHLLPLRILQCLLGAASAAMVGALGRAVSTRHGVWAGILYAVYWPAVCEPSSTMTETLHTALLLAGIVILIRERRPAWGGFVIGLSALTRAVSAAFLPLAAWWAAQRVGSRRGRTAALVLAGGAAAILPWAARNALVMGDLVPVETVSAYNLWIDNAFVDDATHEEQVGVMASQPSAAARRAQARAFAWQGIVQHPAAFVDKVRANFWYLLRPEGLYALLVNEYPSPPWARWASLLADDALLLACVPLLLVFLVAGRPSPPRTLLLIWIGYYVFMLVVVFHVEIRYRSGFIPFLFVGAAGGLGVLSDAAAPRRARAALVLGAVLVAGALAPLARPAWRAAASTWTLREARAALAAGDLGVAEEVASEAAELDPVCARPWLGYGRALVASQRWLEAAEAFRQAAVRRPGHPVPIVVRPWLLRSAGLTGEAEEARRAADELSWTADPWVALELAWRELPPPHADEILLGQGDYGAVRGFLQPRKSFRWSRRRAWLRLVPTQAAAEYEVTLRMGSPAPSPLATPEVTVRVSGAPPARLVLGRDVRPFTLRARPRPGQAVLVELTSPTWNASGQPAEQGVAVASMTLAPVR